LFDPGTVSSLRPLAAIFPLDICYNIRRKQWRHRK
jgi:hypothetical protein